MRLHATRSFLLLFTGSLVLFGCGGSDTAGEDSAGTTSGADAAATREDPNPRPEHAIVVEGADGVYGGRYVATLRMDPKTWNSLTANETSSTDLVNGNLFEGLVAFNNRTQETEALLARSWERSEDGLVWTFHLRRGARWSDGEPLTADDVIFTSEVLYDDVIHPSASELASIDGEPFRFEKIDDYTVQVTLPGPYGPFLNVIGSVYIMPEHKLRAAYEDGSFESTYGVNTPPSELVSGGPWMLAEYQPQQKVVFKPNPYYYKFDPAGNRLPYLDELVWLTVPDQNAEVLKFQSGESDEIYFRAEDYAQMKDGEARGDYTVYDLGMEMGTQMVWFNMNTSNNPNTGKPFVDPAKQRIFGNVDFRRAVAHAIDREAISNTVFYGLAEPLYGGIPPVNKKWHNPDIRKYVYDLEKSRALLDEAGMIDRDGDGIREDENGTRLAFTLITNADNRERIATANILKDDLAKVGVQCNFNPVDFNSVITMLRESYDYDAILLGLTGGIPPDPIMSANVFKSSGKTHFWYPEQETPATEWEAEIDALMNRQVGIVDDAERKKVFDRVQEIVAENVPMLYTVSRPGFIAVRNKFTGLQPTVLRPWVLWKSETVSFNPAEARKEVAARQE